ncbi:hypothetical protein NC651_034819 [Populus alba x Populus x berolinensis]|nr:hypothetical protein NC651_034819 [Populus alba x Populus x berolinensis]
MDARMQTALPILGTSLFTLQKRIVQSEIYSALPVTGAEKQLGLRNEVFCKLGPHGNVFSTGDWEFGGSKRTQVEWHKLVWGPLLHPFSNLEQTGYQIKANLCRKSRSHVRDGNKRLPIKYLERYRSRKLAWHLAEDGTHKPRNRSSTASSAETLVPCPLQSSAFGAFPDENRSICSYDQKAPFSAFLDIYSVAGSDRKHNFQHDSISSILSKGPSA